jgi:cation transport regulator ChaC
MDAICQIDVRPLSNYFAYGSNLLDDEIKRTTETAEPVGVAYLPGYRVKFTKHSESRGCDAASIAKDAGSIVWGFVYRVNEDDQEALKKRELGYREDQDLIALLVPDVSEISEADPIPVFTFIGENTCLDACGPSREYLDLVIRGAEERGLPADYIASLATESDVSAGI